MKIKKFKKHKENFKCANCGVENTGDGFTNHCRLCLWSKHVDIFPGDRLEDCGGLMQPIDMIPKRDNYILIHKCVECGYESKVKTHKNDSTEAILDLNRKLAEEKFNRLVRGE